MDFIIEYLPILIPLFFVELALSITALVHILKHPNYRFGNKPLWIIIILCVTFLGPVIYFMFGRGEGE